MAIALAVTPHELNRLKDLARKWLMECDESLRLPGMGRDLTPEERLTLAYLQGSLAILNRLGAIKDDWIATNQVALDPPDFEPTDEW